MGEKLASMRKSKATNTIDPYLYKQGEDKYPYVYFENRMGSSSSTVPTNTSSGIYYTGQAASGDGIDCTFAFPVLFSPSANGYTKVHVDFDYTITSNYITYLDVFNTTPSDWTQQSSGGYRAVNFLGTPTTSVRQDVSSGTQTKSLSYNISSYASDVLWIGFKISFANGRNLSSFHLKNVYFE